MSIEDQRSKLLRDSEKLKKNMDSQMK